MADFISRACDVRVPYEPYVSAFGTSSMSHFYFHIRAGAVCIPDEEGMDFRDATAARAELRASAVDLAMAAIRAGGGVDARSVEMEDEDGNVLDTLPIRSVLH